VVVTPEGDLRVRVAAPPVEGKANRELMSFLARLLDVAPSRLTLVRGMGSRHKVVDVAGLTGDEALRKIRGAISR
jgi:uncharacterized protein (TIGR00251 family)